MKTNLKVIDVEPTPKEEWITFDKMEKEWGVYAVKGNSLTFIINSEQLGMLVFSEAGDTLCIMYHRAGWRNESFKKVYDKKILVEFSNE